MKIPGIYTITNLVNGKIYVGQTTDLTGRWEKGYLVTLRRKAHCNTYLQRAWNKYGEENFIWEELDRCDKEFLYSQEHYWAILLDVHNPKRGYNDKPTHPEGKGTVSYSTRVKMSNSAKVVSKKKDHTLLKELAEKKKVKVAQYTISGIFMNNFDSMTKAAKYNSIRTGPISDGCIKNAVKAGYRWIKYTDEYPESLLPVVTLKEQQEIKRKEDRIKKIERQQERTRKKIIKLSGPVKIVNERRYTIEGWNNIMVNLSTYRNSDTNRLRMGKRSKGSNNPRAILNEQVVYEIRKEIATKLDKKFDSRWDMIAVRNSIKEKFNLTERRFQQIKGFECWKDVVYNSVSLT